MQMWLEESLLCCIKELDVSLKTGSLSKNSKLDKNVQDLYKNGQDL